MEYHTGPDAGWLLRVGLVALDTAILGGVLPLAFVIRAGMHTPVPHLVRYRDAYVLLTLMYVFLLASVGAYRRRFRSYWHLFSTVFKGLALAGLLATAFLYVFRSRWAAFPSSVIVIAFPMGLGAVWAANGSILGLARAVRRRVAIVGSDADIGVFGPRPRTETLLVHRMEDLADCKDLDELIVCQRIQDERTLHLLVHLFQQLKTQIYFAPRLYARLVSESLNGNGTARFLATFIGRRTESQEFLIRALDLVGSLALLALSAPLWPLIAVWIRLTSPGPVLYTQPRAGKDGRVFTLYKFRTMLDHDGQPGELHPATENDPRVTGVGRFLRRTRLDELPQLINVLQGHMSLVGPRPENLVRVGQHRALQGIRLAVKPGMTGLAQIRGFYDLAPRHKLRYDYLYIQRRSVQLNLYILLMTVPVVLSGHGR